MRVRGLGSLGISGFRGFKGFCGGFKDLGVYGFGYEVVGSVCLLILVGHGATKVQGLGGLQEK